MALEGFNRKAGATNLESKELTLRRCCAEPCFLVSILLLCLGNSYLPRQTSHDFRFYGIRPEADPFEKINKDIETRLEPLRAPHSDQPVVYEKRDTLIAH
jgi:hypothetical protein